MLREALTDQELAELGLNATQEELAVPADPFPLKDFLKVRSFCVSQYFFYWGLLLALAIRFGASPSLLPSWKLHVIFGVFILCSLIQEILVGVALSRKTCEAWDIFGLFVGVCGRINVYLDFLFVVLTAKINSSLFAISFTLFMIGVIFAHFGSQTRAALSLFSRRDTYSTDRVSLFFKMHAIPRFCEDLHLCIQRYVSKKQTHSTDDCPSHQTPPHQPQFSEWHSSEDGAVGVADRGFTFFQEPMVSRQPRRRRMTTDGAARQFGRRSSSKLHVFSIAYSFSISLSRLRLFIASAGQAVRACSSKVISILLLRRHSSPSGAGQPTGGETIRPRSVETSSSNESTVASFRGGDSSSAKTGEGGRALEKVSAEKDSTGIKEEAGEDIREPNCHRATAAVKETVPRRASLELTDGDGETVPRRSSMGETFGRTVAVVVRPNATLTGSQVRNDLRRDAGAVSEQRAELLNAQGVSALRDWFSLSSTRARIERHERVGEMVVGAVKVLQLANLSHFQDLLYIQAILARKYLQADSVEAHEFAAGMVSVSRCFCEDLLQFTLKWCVLALVGANPFVIVCLVWCCIQPFLLCVFNTSDRAIWEELLD